MVYTLKHTNQTGSVPQTGDRTLGVGSQAWSQLSREPKPEPGRTLDLDRASLGGSSSSLCKGTSPPGKTGRASQSKVLSWVVSNNCTSRCPKSKNSLLKTH